MQRDGRGFMTTKGAKAALRLAGEYHAGKRRLPPEIVELKRKIEVATHNAELFTTRMRVVDEGMVNDIVAMKLELDGLYARWAENEARVVI